MAKKSLNYNQSRALGSLLLQQLNNQKPAPSKTRQETPAEEFARLAREEQENFVQVSRPATAYEKAIDGRDTVTISVPRKQYEDKYGITGLRQIYSKSPSELQAMSNNPVERVKMVDPLAQFPRTSTPVEMTEENATKFTLQAQAFLDSKNLSADDRDRLILFVAINADSNSTIDVSNPEIWNIAYRRLIELGCISSDEPNQSTLAPTREPEPSADDLYTDAEHKWLSIFSDVWGQWLDSMAQTWSFYANTDQQRAAIDLLIKLEQYGDDRFNECRRRLTQSGVFKQGMLTPLEQLELRVEAGEFGSLDTQAGKQRYAAAFNRLKFGGE